MSDDGGNTWYFQEYIGGNPISLRGMDMVNENVGYVVTEYGLIYKTTNGGGNLIPIPTLSVADNENIQTGFDIYPNPASDLLTIKLTGNVMESIEVFDNTGLLCLHQNCNSNYLQIDVSKLNPGSYTIRAKSKDKVFLEKFILVK